MRTQGVVLELKYKECLIALAVKGGLHHICLSVQTPVDTQLQLQVKRAATLSSDQVTYEDCMLLTENLQDIKDMLLSICFSKDLVKFHDQVSYTSQMTCLRGAVICSLFQ